MAVPQRIVSLLPGSTEILCALEAEALLVGVSHQCDYPATLSQVPRLTAPVGAMAPLQRDLDEATAALLQAGLSTYPLDLQRLRQLRPDLLVTRIPGALDGVVPRALLEATRRVLGAYVEVLSFQPTWLQDIWDAIHLLGTATGQQRQAATLLETLFGRVNTLVAESIRLPQSLRVVVLSCCEPLRAAGDWLPDMIQIAGGTAGLSRAGAPGPLIDWEQLLDYAPEVLLVMPHDADLAHTRTLLPTLQTRPGWRELPAVQQGQVYLVDGRALWYRPGPRIVEGLEILAGLMHPMLFEECLEGRQDVYETVPS